MSNWLEPACAREAMATGSPEIDTVGVVAVVDVIAAVWVVATFAVAMPSAGTSLVAALAPAAACPFDPALSVDPVPLRLSPCAAVIVVLAWELASACAVARSACVSACWKLAGACAPLAGVAGDCDPDWLFAAFVASFAAAAFAAVASVVFAVPVASPCAAATSCSPPLDAVASARALACAPIAIFDVEPEPEAEPEPGVLSMALLATMTVATGDGVLAASEGWLAVAVVSVVVPLD